MAKKLVGFSRPNITKNMVEEEKQKASDDFVKGLVKQIIDSSEGMFGELSDEEIDEIIIKTLKEENIGE